MKFEEFKESVRLGKAPLKLKYWESPEAIQTIGEILKKEIDLKYGKKYNFKVNYWLSRQKFYEGGIEVFFFKRAYQKEVVIAFEPAFSKKEKTHYLMAFFSNKKGHKNKLRKVADKIERIFNNVVLEKEINEGFWIQNEEWLKDLSVFEIEKKKEPLLNQIELFFSEEDIEVGVLGKY